MESTRTMTLNEILDLSMYAAREKPVYILHKDSTVRNECAIVDVYESGDRIILVGDDFYNKYNKA